MKIAMLIYKMFALLLLFAGGYFLLRFGMNVDERISFYIAAIGMPLVTLIVWLVSYRGKEFR